MDIVSVEEDMQGTFARLQPESSKSSFQFIMTFKEPVCQKECRNGGRCIGPNRCDHYQAIWGYCCQRGQPIVADVHVSMATRDAIARSITELVRATGFLFDNLIQPHLQFLPGKQQRVNAPANFRVLSAQDSFAVPP